MKPGIILRIQSVRCNKVAVLTAEFLCLRIHQRGKSLHIPRRKFRDGHRTVIVGFQHQTI